MLISLKRLSGENLLAADMTKRFRVLAVDHDEDMLTLYRDILCFESEEPSSLEALFAERPRLPSREEIDEDESRPVFDIVPAVSGPEGLAAIERSLEQGAFFAVALIDVHLSATETNRAGLDLARKLRELDPSIEIVLLSARHDVPLKEINRRVQPPEKLLFLQKPFRSARTQADRHFARSQMGCREPACATSTRPSPPR